MIVDAQEEIIRLLEDRHDLFVGQGVLDGFVDGGDLLLELFEICGGGVVWFHVCDETRE